MRKHVAAKTTPEGSGNEQISSMSEWQDHSRIIATHLALLITAQATSLHDFVQDLKAIATIRDCTIMLRPAYGFGPAAIGVGLIPDQLRNENLKDMIHDRHNLSDTNIDVMMSIAQKGIDYYETLLSGMRHIISSENIDSPKNLIEILTQKAVSCRLDRMDFRVSAYFNRNDTSGFDQFSEWRDSYVDSAVNSSQYPDQMRDAVEGLSYVIGESSRDELMDMANSLASSFSPMPVDYHKMMHIIRDLTNTTKDIMLQNTQNNMVSAVDFVFQETALNLTHKAINNLLDNTSHTQNTQIILDLLINQDWFDVFKGAPVMQTPVNAAVKSQTETILPPISHLH